MVTNLTRDNLEEVKLSRLIVAFRSAAHIYVLTTGAKNTAMFVPLKHDADCRYKCKNVKASIKAAIAGHEQVSSFNSHEEMFAHFSN